MLNYEIFLIAIGLNIVVNSCSKNSNAKIIASGGYYFNNPQRIQAHFYLNGIVGYNLCLRQLINTTFRIPVTQEQYDGLKSWYEGNVGKSPYPYMRLGLVLHATNMNLQGIDKSKVNFYNRLSLKKRAGL